MVPNGFHNQNLYERVNSFSMANLDELDLRFIARLAAITPDSREPGELSPHPYSSRPSSGEVLHDLALLCVYERVLKHIAHTKESFTVSNAQVSVSKHNGVDLHIKPAHAYLIVPL